MEYTELVITPPPPTPPPAATRKREAGREKEEINFLFIRIFQ